MTKSFREILEDEYSVNPSRLGSMADAAFRLVRVRRKWWRGQRVISDGSVVVGDTAVIGEAVSDPRWNLLPAYVKEEFSALEASVNKVLDSYACGGKYATGTGMESLVGNGVYVIDSVVWPRVKSLLDAAANQWGEKADALCSSDGYSKLIELVREKVASGIGSTEITEDGRSKSEVTVDRACALVPRPDELRKKFALSYEIMPVRLAPDQSDNDSDVARGRKSAALDVLEAAVRVPRERLAVACGKLAVAAREAVTGDSVRSTTVAAVSRAVSEFKDRNGRSDPVLASALFNLTEKLGRGKFTTADELMAVADAAEAVRLSAVSESGMAASLGVST